MNVQTRQEFDIALADIASVSIIAFDTETNSLDTYHGKPLISISVYLPEFDTSYNFPFRHGEGEVQDTIEDFDDATWQGKGKKRSYLSYWYNQMKPSIDFQNLSLAWLEDLKAVWAKKDVLYIGHNIRFDMHVLDTENFPHPTMVHDTMIALHTIHEDWRGIQFTAPYKYTLKDKTSGLCGKDDVGTWAKETDGTLRTKRQYGNRELKWQAARIGLEGATVGEIGLHKAISNFRQKMVDYIVYHWSDPVNESLVLKSFAKDMSKEGLHDMALMDKQAAKFAAKIEISDKANMWMLPSSFVAEYAELDTKLTYGLYLWCMENLKSWNNEQLFLDMSRIHYKFAYQMEINGFKVDVKQAEAEIAKLNPRIQDIEYIISLASVGICWDKPELYECFDEQGCNVASPKQLLPFLNSGILEVPFSKDLWPNWWPVELTADLEEYEDVELYKTNKVSLEPYGDSAIVRIIREHRRLNKSVNTYLGNWLKARDDKDIVRFNMNADGTSTGRMSSSGDAGNGQNIPDRNGYTIKRAIVPYNDSWRLFALDYGQLELRLAAWIAEGLLGLDPNMSMTNLFIGGHDMHSYVRDMINVRQILFGTMEAKDICLQLGYKPDSKEIADAEGTVSGYCRQAAKTMNFGLLYSGTEVMLSKLLKIDKSAAKLLVTHWRSLFPAFPKAQEYYTKLALTYRSRPLSTDKSMYVTQPISGRHRRIDRYPTWMTFMYKGIEKGFNPRESEAAKTWNSTVQGLGGYLCTMSGTRFIEETGTQHLKPFAQIHDAIDGCVRVDQLSLVQVLGNYMIDWPEIVPALTVDIQGSIDGTWQGMTKIKNFKDWKQSYGKEGYS